MTGSTFDGSVLVPQTPVSLAGADKEALEFAGTKLPYTKDQALDDIPTTKTALRLFLSSKMVESEELMRNEDPQLERMYIAAGIGLIQAIKSLMSFEDEDLLNALGNIRHAATLASQHRKDSGSLLNPWKLAGLVLGSSSGVGFIRSMTPVELHAELVYAECLLEKAVVGIVYSGDWLQFIKEALNMRTAMGIFRNLMQFLETVDAEAEARGEGPEDKSIDNDFRSGVYLGMGLTHLVLSLLPSRVVAIVELFGYKGERDTALKLLTKAGGWTKDSREPSFSAAEEGLRRSICDMALLIFHLVLSSFTVSGVDIPFAQNVLDWNTQRYPTGVFYLLSQGRLQLIRSQPRQSIETYHLSMKVQSQYPQLYHLAYWEIAVAHLALNQVSEAIDFWQKLFKESTWSKAVYCYASAACMLQSGQTRDAAALFAKVPSLLQRIAGKSIPVEKFVARKSRKFEKQGERLMLPALEITYLFLGISRAPKDIIQDQFLPLLDKALQSLSEFSPPLTPSSTSSSSSSKTKNGSSQDPTSLYGNGKGGYWDDLCLALFLKGVCLRYLGYPDPDALVDETIVLSIPNAGQLALETLNQVLTHGPKIELDHHLVYHAHYEIGRLHACMGDKKEAKRHLDLVLSGKPLEVNAAGRKGKYSMENALIMRAHAALEALEHNRQL